MIPVEIAADCSAHRPPLISRTDATALFSNGPEDPLGLRDIVPLASGKMIGN